MAKLPPLTCAAHGADLLPSRVMPLESILHQQFKAKLHNDADYQILNKNKDIKKLGLNTRDVIFHFEIIDLPHICNVYALSIKRSKKNYFFVNTVSLGTKHFSSHFLF